MAVVMVMVMVMVIAIAITYMSFYQMQDTILSSLHKRVYLIPVTAIWGRYCECSHLAGEEIEAQKV